MANTFRRISASDAKTSDPGGMVRLVRSALLVVDSEGCVMAGQVVHFEVPGRQRRAGAKTATKTRSAGRCSRCQRCPTRWCLPLRLVPTACLRSRRYQWRHGPARRPDRRARDHHQCRRHRRGARGGRNLGGKIAAGRQAVGNMGFTGYFVDTEGNTVGLWQNAR